jgi:hypothetical protein
LLTEARASLQPGQTMAGAPEPTGGERSEMPGSGGAPAIVRDSVPTLSMAPDPEVPAHRVRHMRAAHSVRWMD